MLLINELGEFVDPEPGCAYPSLAEIKPRRLADDGDWPMYGKVCPGCGREFRTDHKTRVYCSESCRSSAYRRRKKEGK